MITCLSVGLNAKFELAYTEAASVPLAAQKAHKQLLRQTQLVTVGSPAGAAFGATSDAFLAALQDAKRLTNLIGSKEPLTSFKLNKIDAGMDALFLSFLQKKAVLGSHSFVRIFPNYAPASLILFLTG